MELECKELLNKNAYIFQRFSFSNEFIKYEVDFKLVALCHKFGASSVDQTSYSAVTRLSC